MDEFQLIDRYFRRIAKSHPDVVLGVGDDAAILAENAGRQFLVTSDTHVEGVHFHKNSDPAKIGYRAFASSASDIVAMGGHARWASLALTIPNANDHWLKNFTLGSAQAMDAAGAILIGGDTTSGPLTITWNIIGTIDPGSALRRNGARDGDAIFVTGSIGGAAAALALGLTESEPSDKADACLAQCYWRPRPRYKFGPKLVGLASSCIDISDGLVADLTHIAHASHCGAEIELGKLPIVLDLRQRVGQARASRFASVGGDDYELCFTVSQWLKSTMLEVAQSEDVQVTEIGNISKEPEVRIFDASGDLVEIDKPGYQHFV